MSLVRVSMSVWLFNLTKPLIVSHSQICLLVRSRLGGGPARVAAAPELLCRQQMKASRLDNAAAETGQVSNVR